jgi:uncharacterized membrane protein YphA (DoxX/SURF4 family)
MPIAATTIQILMILFFTPAALLKLAGHSHMRREFKRFDLPYALARIAGAVELVAALLLIAGFVHGPLSVLGALLLVPVMLGATWVNVVKRPPAYGWGTAVILLLCGGLAAYRGIESFAGCSADAGQALSCIAHILAGVQVDANL